MLIERSPIIEFKFSGAAPDAGEIAGVAAAFGNVDSVGDICAPGCFAASLAEHKAAGTMPALLWSHQPSEPIGRLLDLRESTRGLEVRGKLSDVPRGRDARTLALDGALGFSIGYITRDFDYDAGGHRILRAVDVRKISIVAVPANSRAKITSIKSALADGEQPSPKILETILREAGVPKALAAGVITKGWRGASDNQREAESAAIKSITDKLNAATAALKGC